MWGLYLENCLQTYSDMNSVRACGGLTPEVCPSIYIHLYGGERCVSQYSIRFFVGCKSDTRTEVLCVDQSSAD